MMDLEDTFSDVLMKAQRGMKWTDAELGQRAGVAEERVRALRTGTWDEGDGAKVATALGLGSKSLAALARGDYHPRVDRKPDGLAQFTSQYQDMRVNAFIVWDPASREAAVFDSGTDAAALLSFLKQTSLKATHIFVTHTHTDHIADLDRLRHATAACVHSPAGEPLPEGAQPIQPGTRFHVGRLIIESRSTKGHAVDGLSYIITGLTVPLAVVGDALFAGSMGGPKVSYEDCLSTANSALFTLPPETLVCPGHGPLTTIALERANNPFFSGN